MFSPFSFLGKNTISWTPADFADVKYWWTADDGITESGGEVSSWIDKISGFNMSQTVGANRPTLTTSATLNNQNVISFNGTTDYLYTSQSIDSWTEDLTILSVLNLVDTKTGGTLMGAVQIGAQNRMWWDTLNGALRVFNQNLPNSVGVGANLEATASLGAKSYKWRYDKSAGETFYAIDTLNETSISTGVNTTTNIGNLASVAIGATVADIGGAVYLGRYVQVEVAEQIWIFGTPSTLEMDEWKAYVNNKYGGIIDAEAEAFFTATGITNPTTQTAIIDLVDELKVNNVWNDLDIFYPFVGETLGAHSKNLINTGSYTLSYNGVPTTSNSGLKFNGTTQYATIPGLNPNIFWTTANNAMFGMSYNQSGSLGQNPPQAGIFQASGGGDPVDMMATMGTSGRLGPDQTISFGSVTTPTTFILNRNNSGYTEAWKNGSLANTGSSDTWDVDGLRTTPFFTLGAAVVKTNFDDYYTGYNDARLTSYFFGNTLTPTQLSALNTAVNNFNTSLSRNTFS